VVEREKWKDGNKVGTIKIARKKAKQAALSRPLKKKLGSENLFLTIIDLKKSFCHDF